MGRNYRRAMKWCLLGFAVSLVLVSVVQAASTSYQEAPILRALVEEGKLPPVEERLPKNPLVVEPVDGIGIYGGTAQVYAPNIMNLGDGYMSMVGMEYLLGINRDFTWGTPNIIEGWELSDDARSMTLHLRPGLKWSDGYPFTSEDFMYFYDHVLTNKELFPAYPSWATVGGELVKFSAPDEYTVIMEFPVPNAAMANELSLSAGNQPGILWNFGTFQAAHFAKQFHPDFIGEEEATRKAKEAGFETWVEYYNHMNDTLFGLPLWPGTPPVMNAYVCVDRKMDRWIFQRNPYYWKVDSEGNQLPYIDQVVVYLAESADVIEGKIISGEVTFQPGDPAKLPIYIEKADAGNYRVLIAKSGSGSSMPLQLNLTHPDPVIRDIFQDIRFRQAVSLSIDRDAINEASFFGLATPRAHTPPLECEYVEPEFATAYIEYDPDQACTLLDQMGLDKRDGDGYRLRPDGKRLILTIEVLGVPPALEIIQENLKEIGLDVRLKAEDFGLFSQRVPTNEVDIIVQTVSQNLEPAFTSLPQFFVPMSWGWATNWAVQWSRWYATGGQDGEEPPAEMRELIEWWEQMKRATTSEERIELGRKIIKSHSENLWVIGTIGLTPVPIIVDKGLGNLPPKGFLYSWDTLLMVPYEPSQFYFKDAKPIEEVSPILYQQ